MLLSAEADAELGNSEKPFCETPEHIITNLTCACVR